MPHTLLDTLLLTPGLRARLVNVPKSVRPLFEALPDGVHVNESGAEPADWLIVFVKDRPTLDAFATVAVSEVKYDGVLWIAYPKTAGDGLSREAAGQAMEPFGFEPVADAVVDDTWSALRFRPKERLGH